MSVYYSAAGLLRGLDIPDISVPLAEIRSFLNGRYAERFFIDPSRLETTVAAVFSGLDFRSRVVGAAGDGGIDVVLDGPDNITIGVQVKRYKNKIEAHQIREFAGALFIKDMIKGIFVTTSDYTSGAKSVSDLSAIRGIPIELYNAERFFDAMKIAHIPSFRNPEARLVLTCITKERDPSIQGVTWATRRIRSLRLVRRWTHPIVNVVRMLTRIFRRCRR